MEDNIAGFDEYLASDILVSDWSGAALEFAFGLERPVIYIDLPLKVNNPDYQSIDATPLEKFIRSRIGTVIDPWDISRIGETVRNIIENYSDLVPAIRAARDEWIFNVGKSRECGARIIHDLLGDLTETPTSVNEN